MQLSLSLEEVAAIVQAAETRGSTDRKVTGLAALDTAIAGDLSFLGNPKYKAQVASTAATVVLLPKDFAGEPKPGQAFLLLDKPSVGLARLCARLEQSLWPKPVPGVHPTAVVAADAKISPSATIGPFCVIESGVEVGERTHLQAQVFLGRSAVVGADCWLMPRVTVSAECILRDRVRLQPGVVIGRHCIVCAQVGISGSTTLEDYVIVGGQAGLAGHVRVGRASKIDGQTGVNSDLEPQSFVKGSPCLPYNLEQRINVLRRKLPELFKRVDALEEHLKKPSAVS
jgi:UDP-3-O-[3-hydroxymyristoyl] glucosamine N-acyltransferase